MCKVSINIVAAVYFREHNSRRIVRAHITVTIEANILLRLGDIARKAAVLSSSFTVHVAKKRFKIEQVFVIFRILVWPPPVNLGGGMDHITCSLAASQF